jgi:hypothetical protein
VLIVSPSADRATGLYHTESGYEELIQAIGGADGQPSGSLSQPAGVELDQTMEVRLTWLIHDVSVWRTDGVYITRSDGVWINTLTDFDPGSGDLFDQAGRWHRPKDDAALLAVLKSSGILASSVAPLVDSTPQGSAAASTAAAASASQLPLIAVGIIAVVAGLAGLALGAQSRSRGLRQHGSDRRDGELTLPRPGAEIGQRPIHGRLGQGVRRTPGQAA